ncbi:MAG: sugar phosphate isomerase/epimerase [Synergistaceae bacterium]|jgi:sugar phosphate isomerase/epimerase|nr:sugar phosphate isomerase/epimerase [Synergistaceae bacterium]
MTLYISVVLLDETWTRNLLSLLENLRGYERIGLEIFPMFHIGGYSRILDKFLPKLAELPITFHEPYYETDHSCKRGSVEYRVTMEHCKNAFDYAARLRAGHIVYHLNNRAISNKDEMLRIALENLIEINDLADSYGLKLLIENTGVSAMNNVLLDENDFVDLFDMLDHDCLIDTGHANCNKWNLGSVMERLQGRIRSYHLHNNFGANDDHNRIFEGTLDLGEFFRNYSRYTPDADIVLEYKCLLTPDIMNDDIEWIKEDVSHVRRMTCAVETSRK